VTHLCVRAVLVTSVFCSTGLGLIMSLGATRHSFTSAPVSAFGWSATTSDGHADACALDEWTGSARRCWP